MRILAWIAFTAAAIASAIAIAQPPITITDSGYWVTVVDADGTPSLVRIETVIDLRSGDNPADPIPDPQPPKPEIDVAAVRDVESIAKSVEDPQGAQGIARVYAHVYGALLDDTIDTSRVWEIVKRGTDEAVVQAGTKDWSVARRKVSDLIASKQSRGELATKSDVLKLLFSIQHGFELAADGSEMLNLAQQTRINLAINKEIFNER